MDIVKRVLEEEQREAEKYKSIQVTKHLEAKVDLGYLLCSDPNDLDEKRLKKDREQYLADLTRDNVQLIVNELWEQPTERVEECIVAKLPAPSFVLPRSKKCPVPRALTKWEQFALEKGIKKTKKDKKVFDQDLDKWVPTYGFKRAQAEREKDWVLEVPQNADPMEDQFAKKANVKAENVAKNEIKRMRNIVKAKKGAIPRTGYLGPDTASSSDLQIASTIAKASTASVGKFQGKLPKEKPARGIGVKELIPGAKRKASHITDGDEKIANLELINSVLSKKSKIDDDKAFSVQKREEREERESKGEPTKTAKKGKKGHGKAKGKGKFQKSPGRKPKAGAGERDPKKRFGGRKRR